MTWANLKVEHVTLDETHAFFDSILTAAKDMKQQHHDSNTSWLSDPKAKHEGKFSSWAVPNKTFYSSSTFSKHGWNQKDVNRTMLIEINKQIGNVKLTGVRPVCMALAADLILMWKSYKAMINDDGADRLPPMFHHLTKYMRVPAWFTDPDGVVKLCDEHVDAKDASVSRESYQALVDLVVIAKDHLKDHPEVLHPLITLVKQRFPTTIIKNEETEWSDVSDVATEVFPDCSRCGDTLVKVISQSDSLTMQEFMCRKCGAEPKSKAVPVKPQVKNEPGSSSGYAGPLTSARGLYIREVKQEQKDASDAMVNQFLAAAKNEDCIA